MKGKNEIARDFINIYLNTAELTGISCSKRSLANALYLKRPDIFKDIEDARYYIRYVTGATGNKKANLNDEIAKAFALLGQPIVECEIKPFTVPKQYTKALVLSDIHSRFYDRQAVEIAINYGIKRGCNLCIINGDLLDLYQYSRFDKNPNIMQYFYSEREWVQDFLLLLQKAFGKVIYKKGNHDIRRELHIQRRLADVPEIRGLESVQDYVFFDGSTVDVIEDYNVIEFGKLNIIHGHEYQGGGGIHVAYNRLNKTMDNTLSAHSHITQSSMKKSISGQFYGSWTSGCLCSLSPRYNPQNNWNNGFTAVERDEIGEFEVDNKMIVGGRIF